MPATVLLKRCWVRLLLLWLGTHFRDLGSSQPDEDAGRGFTQRMQGSAANRIIVRSGSGLAQIDVWV